MWQKKALVLPVVAFAFLALGQISCGISSDRDGLPWIGETFVSVDSDTSLPGCCHTATLLRSGKVLIAGGALGAMPLSSAEIYDPVTKRFERTGSMMVARQFHAACLLADGRVLVVGGSGDAGGTAEIYDPSGGAFRLTGPLNVPRNHHTATTLPDGRVVVAGGTGRNGALDSAELYDPSPGVFRKTGKMHTPRTSQVAFLVDSRVVVLGGTPQKTSKAEGYDSATGAFVEIGEARWQCAAVSIAALTGPSIFVLGFNCSWTPVTFDPRTGNYRDATGGTVVPPGGLATTLADQRVLLTGGYEWRQPPPHWTPFGGTTQALVISSSPTARAEVYDPVRNKITAIHEMNTPRSGAYTATLL